MTYRDFSADLRTTRLLAGARRASRSPIARLLLAGTALGCTLLPASHAAAQVVREQSADGSPIVIQSGTIVAPAGTGAGIEATTTGAITITSADVTTESAAGHGIVANGGTGAVQIDSGVVRTSGAGAYGVTATTTSGGIQISSDEILTTGSGQIYGISAVTGGGSIAIESGVVNVASSGSNNARGIVANSGGGDITIDAGTTTGHSRAIFTTTLFSGPELGFTAGNTRITSESAIATGGNAIIGQGYSVALTSGRAEGTANPDFTAATIYVSAGEGGATLAAGETIGHGYGQYGIQALSTGALSITSSSVTTDGVFGNGITAIGSAAMAVDSGSVATVGDNSHGIVAQAYTRYSGEPVSITSDAIATQGRASNGIFVQSFESEGGMTGDITIDSGTIETAGQLSHGIVVAASADPGYAYRPVSASAGTGALSVTSDSIVASGPGGRGIVFDHAGAISLTSGTIDAQAGGIYMWAGSTVDITSGDVTTAGGPGIVVYGATGDVTLDAGSTEVGANGDTGIYVETTTGNVSITADRTVTNSLQPLNGFTADGIVGISSAGGNVSIDSGIVSVKGESAFGIYGSTTGLVSIASDQVSTAGANGIGIYAGGSAGVAIDSGSIVTLGSGAYGIRARSANGDVAVTSASIRTEGANAAGIFVPTSVGGGAIMGGDITIDSGTIETAGQLSHGIVVAASADPGYAYRPVSASAGTGALSVTSDSIVASGPGGRGIVFDHAGAISLTSGTIDAQAGGIYMWAGSTVDITSGDVTTAGGPGIVVYGATGDVTLDAGSTEVGANGDTGIYVETTTGNVSITADRTVTNSLQPLNGFTADGIVGISSAGGNVSIDSGIVSVKGESAFGIYGSTTGLVSIASDQVSTAGANGIGIYAGGSAGVAIDSGSVVTLGSGAYGIRARSANGDVAVTSASIRTEGANAAGIFVPTSVGGGAIMGGDITIDSGTIATSGANSNGISVAASASPAYGMRPAQGGTGALAITSDAIETSGANSWGIAVDHRGPIAIDSGTIKTQAGAGIYVWAEDLVTIKSGTIETPNGPGIVVYGGAGDVDIASGTATVGSGGDVGVWARTTTGDIKIVADTTTTARQDILDGQYTADGVTGISAGGGSVTIEAGTTAVVGESAFGVTALTTGLASVTSGTVTTAGANGVGIYARGDAGVSVRSGDVTTAGSAAHGIQATSTTGGIAIASTGTIAVSAAGAAGVLARTTSGAIDAAVASVSASDGSAVELASTAGGALSLGVTGTVTGAARAVVLASAGTGAVTNSGTIRTNDGTGVLFDLATATLTNSGTIDAGGIGVDVTGAFSASNSGRIVSAGTAIRAAQPATIGNSGTITSNGGVAVMLAEGGTVVNTGTIFGAEAALAAGGAVTLDNAGVLGSNSGIAAVFSAGNDTLVLRTGSAITGLVDGGDGQDVATLIGTGAQPSEGQQIGRLDNFEGLNVANGYWSTTGYVGAFQNVQIAADGALQVNEVPGSGGDAAIDTLDVVNNGLLLFNFTSDVAVDAEAPLAVSGTGAVALIGSGTVEVATDTLTHTGGTLVANGTLLLTGSLPGDVTTTGAGRFVLTDSAGFSGNLVNDGTFVFARTDSYDFVGDFSGSGMLEKQGEGVLTFAGDYSFVGTTKVLGGSVKFAGLIDPETEFDLTSGTLDLSSQDQTIGGLAGTQQSSVNLGASQLTVNQTENSVFAGEITGSGGLTLAGGGLLNLTGNSTYTGTTTVQQGTLKVNGSIVAPVVINAGGVLGGNGSVGSTTVGGGRIGPGNSIGRLSVAGDLAFGAGSVYEVEVNAAGGADRIDVAGSTTIASTARVEVLAENGNYRPLTEYTILTSAGGISGTFGSVTSNLAFLTPRLRYASNAVTLNLYRNDIDFAAVATGANQVAVGNAVEALGLGNGLYEEVLVQSAAGARSAYDALAGEINATTSTALIDESRYLRDAVLSAAPPEDTAGMFLIGSVFGGWGEIEGRGGLAAADIDHKGVLAGLGYAGQGVSVGIAGSVGRSTHQLEARSGRSKVDTASVAGFVGYAAGGLEAKAGASFGWHQIDANRSAVVGAVGSDLHSGHDATTRQLFGGVAFDLVSGELDLAPFARIANIRVHHDGYAEAGGPAALTIAARSQDVTLLTLGADARIPLTPGVKAKLSGGWQHGWGDLAAATDNRFAGSTSGFRITGAALPKDSALVDAGIEADLQGFRLGVSYVGSYASGWTDHGARATVSINF